MEHVDNFLGEQVHVAQPLGMVDTELLSEAHGLLAQQQDSFFDELDRFDHQCRVERLVP
jgi:hypothetical protein